MTEDFLHFRLPRARSNPLEREHLQFVAIRAAANGLAFWPRLSTAEVIVRLFHKPPDYVKSILSGTAPAISVPRDTLKMLPDMRAPAVDWSDVRASGPRQLEQALLFNLDPHSATTRLIHLYLYQLGKRLRHEGVEFDAHTSARWLIKHWNDGDEGMWQRPLDGGSTRGRSGGQGAGGGTTRSTRRSRSAKRKGSAKARATRAAPSRSDYSSKEIPLADGSKLTIVTSRFSGTSGLYRGNKLVSTGSHEAMELYANALVHEAEQRASRDVEAREEPKHPEQEEEGWRPKFRRVEPRLASTRSLPPRPGQAHSHSTRSVFQSGYTVPSAPAQVMTRDTTGQGENPSEVPEQPETEQAQEPAPAEIEDETAHEPGSPKPHLDPGEVETIRSGIYKRILRSPQP